MNVFNELVDFCFQGGNGGKLSVTKTGARWVFRKNKNSIIFDKDLVKQSLKYLMDNCYFTFGNKVFRQIIGIPMESDPAPIIANLFLYYYESKLVKGLKKEES